MKQPEITVFMAAYNQEKYIEKSINSILEQSFSDFELVIVNDGSTDDTVAIVESFSDDRIRLMHNAGNRGLIFTRNRLLDIARGKYIAILDADDIAYHDRLKHQYQFLRKNPDVVLCGGHANIIDEHNRATGAQLRVPVDNTVNMFMLFGNPFVNSTTMFRTESFKAIGGYQEYEISEDYDLFIRMSNGQKVANLDETLIDYRVHSNNTSALHLAIRLENEQRIISSLRSMMGVSVDEFSLKIHFELFSWHLNKDHLTNYANLLSELKLANRISKTYDSNRFERFLFDKWCAILLSDQVNGLYLKWYFNPALFSLSYFNLKKMRKALKNSIINVF